MTQQHHDTDDAPSMQRPDPVAEPGDHLMFEHPDGEAVLVLDEDQVWRLLRRVRHARLGLAVDGRPDIVPVNVRAHDGAIYFRTAPGSKLAELTVNPRVVVQADGILADQAWSVLVHGTARRLDTEAEIAEAESLGIEPWVPTLKDFYVRVDVQRVSGRHFVFGPHPERNESQTDCAGDRAGKAQGRAGGCAPSPPAGGCPPPGPPIPSCSCSVVVSIGTSMVMAKPFSTEPVICGSCVS